MFFISRDGREIVTEQGEKYTSADGVCFKKVRAHKKVKPIVDRSLQIGPFAGVTGRTVYSGWWFIRTQITFASWNSLSDGVPLGQ